MRKMVTDRLTIHDRSRMTPKIGYYQLVAASHDLKMMPRQMKWLLVFQQQVGALIRFSFARGWHPADHVRQVADLDWRRAYSGAQGFGLRSESYHRGRVNQRNCRPTLRLIVAMLMRRSNQVPGDLVIAPPQPPPKSSTEHRTC